jgi:ribosomal 50S subunit-associated protein YjgA (DUF615 family)
MPIREHVDVHLDLLAQHALDRIPPLVHLGADRLDDDARRRRLQFVARLIQA